MANVAQQLTERIDALIAPVIQNGRPIERTLVGAGEIKLYLGEVSLIQKQLRSLKSEINLRKKEIRANFAQQLAHVSTHPVFGLLAGKKKAAHVSMQDKARIKRQQEDTLKPYDHAVQQIDRYLLMMDHMKLQIQQQIT